jgi:hypothetical protein
MRNQAKRRPQIDSDHSPHQFFLRLVPAGTTYAVIS